MFVMYNVTFLHTLSASHHQLVHVFFSLSIFFARQSPFDIILFFWGKKCWRNLIIIVMHAPRREENDKKKYNVFGSNWREELAGRNKMHGKYCWLMLSSFVEKRDVIKIAGQIDRYYCC